MTQTRIYAVTDGDTANDPTTDGERYASEQAPSEPITSYAARRGE